MSSSSPSRTMHWRPLLRWPGQAGAPLKIAMLDIWPSDHRRLHQRRHRPSPADSRNPTTNRRRRLAAAHQLLHIGFPMSSSLPTGVAPWRRREGSDHVWRLGFGRQNKSMKILPLENTQRKQLHEIFIFEMCNKYLGWRTNTNYNDLEAIQTWHDGNNGRATSMANRSTHSPLCLHIRVYHSC